MYQPAVWLTIPAAAYRSCAMKLAIIGLPGAGKTTLLNALTGAGKATGAFDQKANLAEIKVPDDRLDLLTEHFEPKKKTPAVVRFTDVPGILPGESNADRLSQVRDSDALIHVIRAFESDSYPHPLGELDPERDQRELDGELALSDMMVLEKRLGKLRGLSGKPRFTEENAEELALLERLLPHLEETQTLLDFEMTSDEQFLLKSFAPITSKLQLLVVNQDESELDRVWLKDCSTPVVSVPALLEADLLELPADEQAEFMADMGVETLSRAHLLQRSYELLGLITFFTVGEDECRAWTLKDGASAVDAAGEIHSDLARGFIRAEVVAYADFVACGSIAKARDAGKFRLEGKEYVVQDGDIITVRFSV